MPSRKEQPVRALSKTKLMAFKQCRKRLWLELHRPALREDSAATEAAFAAGNDVGKVARKLYDPADAGHLIEIRNKDFDAAFAKSAEWLNASVPLFEAA